jgi:lysophospholipase L1-like esterase
MAPAPLTRLTEFAQMLEGGVEKSRELAPLYAELARTRGCHFFDAGKVISCSDLDGVHFEAPAHRALGEAVAREVKKILHA